MIVTVAEAALFCGDAGLGGDPMFELIVAGVDAQVKDFLDRQLEFGTFVEYPAPKEGRRSSVIRLREWPIAAITEVAIDPFRAFGTDTIFASNRFVYQPDDNLVRWLDGYFPPGFENFAVPAGLNSDAPDGIGTIRVTYNAGFYPVDDIDDTHQPRMPGNARLGMLKQIRLEWESEGAVLLSETFGDHAQTFALPSIAGAVILDPSVKSVLRSLKRYA